MLVPVSSFHPRTEVLVGALYALRCCSGPALCKERIVHEKRVPSGNIQDLLTPVDALNIFLDDSFFAKLTKHANEELSRTIYSKYPVNELLQLSRFYRRRNTGYTAGLLAL